MKKIIQFFTILFLSPALALAQAGSNPGNTQIYIPNPCTGCGNDFISLLSAIINNIVMPIATVVVVVLIIWAGFSYLTAQGNPRKIEEAHKRLLWTLIGAGILLSAAGISLVVRATVENLLH